MSPYARKILLEEISYEGGLPSGVLAHQQDHGFRIKVGLVKGGGDKLMEVIGLQITSCFKTVNMDVQLHLLEGQQLALVDLLESVCNGGVELRLGVFLPLEHRHGGERERAPKCSHHRCLAADSGLRAVSAAAPKLVAGRTFETGSAHRLLGAVSWQRWAGGGLAASVGEAQPLPWAAGLGKLGRESCSCAQCENAHARAAAPVSASAFSHTGAFWNNKGAYLPTLNNAQVGFPDKVKG